MIDPAYEAGARVIKRWTTRGWNASRDFVAIEGAREAFRTVQALHFPLRMKNPPPGVSPYAGCSECRKPWPCPTARFIYVECEMP